MRILIPRVPRGEEDKRAEQLLHEVNRQLLMAIMSFMINAAEAGDEEEEEGMWEDVAEGTTTKTRM